MTTPVMNILDLVQQSHLSYESLEKFETDIKALYERQTKESRDVFLLNDFKSLILRHRMAEGCEKAQFNIENIIMYLLLQANDLDSRLPDPNIEHYKQLHLNFPENRLYQVIAEAYRDEIKANSKETKKNFASSVKDKSQSDRFLFAIHEVMDTMTTIKGKAKVIVACIGVWIDKPTYKSITDEFNIKENKASAFRDYILFHEQPDNRRAPQKGFPFPEKDLKEIQERIKDAMKRYDNRRSLPSDA